MALNVRSPGALEKSPPPTLAEEEERCTKKVKNREEDPMLAEIKIEEEDVMIGSKDEVTEIKFSDKVRTLMSQSMELTVMVKLLGGSISYRALCTKLQDLWSLEGKMKVADAEYGYFMDKLSRIGSDIRFPGLPFYYYHKNILRWIAGSLGSFIKVDYSTPDVKRVDGGVVAIKEGEHELPVSPATPAPSELGSLSPTCRTFGESCPEGEYPTEGRVARSTLPSQSVGVGCHGSVYPPPMLNDGGVAAPSCRRQRW
ncbi:hypothetical protein Scep_012979 [Stephania cephalantha]|uniref:Uncharacterized protein n=1 Tax=Stephania cephalantha TaxID=152367 RepID=A0AAP0PAB7_9MAGN